VILVSEVVDLAEEYEKAQQKLKEVRGLLSDRIIKHLIGRSVGPGASTEVGVSQILGMPRTTVRNVMQDLISEDVLYQEPTRSRPTFKPYSVKSVLTALEKGYVSFTKEEFEDLFRVMEKGEDTGYGSWGMPFIGDVIDGKHINRFLTASLRNSLKELMTRFREFRKEESVSDLLRRFYGEDRHREIMLMFPEHEILNDMVEPGEGLLARWIPFQEARSNTATPEETGNLLRKGIEAKLKTALSTAQEFIDEVGPEGFPSFKERFEEQTGKSFPKEAVWGYTSALRQAGHLGREVGVSEGLLMELEGALSKLDSMVD